MITLSKALKFKLGYVSVCYTKKQLLIIIRIILWNVTKPNSGYLRERILLQNRNAKYNSRYFLKYRVNIVRV